MTKKEKPKYKLTGDARKYIRKRSKAEAGLAAQPKKKMKQRSKLGQAITGKRYKIPTKGTGTELGQEKIMVKPKSVGYKYKKIKGSTPTEKSKQVGTFDTSGKSEQTYTERIGAKHRSRGERTAGSKAADKKFHKSTPEAKENQRLREEGGGKYKKGSRTTETISKKRDLKQGLLKSQAKYGEKSGARKFKRERKKKYKREFRETGFLSK